MTRLRNSDEPAPGDQLPQGASRPARARTNELSPGIVDVAGESLSAFASERDLPLGLATPPARDLPKPPVQEPARPRAVPPPPRRPVAPPAESQTMPPVMPSGTRLVIPVLFAVAFVEAALFAWLWFVPGGWRRDAGTSSVTITSEPRGAEVLIDGEAHGRTPVTLAMAVGSHQLQVGTEGAAWTQMLEVKSGQSSSLHVVQTGAAMARSDAPEHGTLDITTEPAGLAVTVDRRPAGISPISVGDLRPGLHEVSVTRGTAVTRRTVSVEAGVPTAVLIATATPGGTGTSGTRESGWLVVTAPVPVRILDSGKLVGTSETARLALGAGRHDLEFVNETFGYRVARTVAVAAGEVATADLAPATGTLSVNAQPWAEVWLDGKRIGETPIGNLSLPIGNHDLMVRHPQLGERRQTVAVAADTPSRIGIDLRQ